VLPVSRYFSQLLPYLSDIGKYDDKGKLPMCGILIGKP
jgi:hypothetical protein